MREKGIGASSFTIGQIAEIIPRGTAGVDNYTTYGFSVMSMLSGQKGRDYFIFENPMVKDEFTLACRNPKRDNHYWKKHYSDARLRINPKYVQAPAPPIFSVESAMN